MEETAEEPPMSAVLLDDCHFSQVIFNSVEKFYVPGGDVTCFYTFTQQFVPRRKDWIGIFRVGWKTTREYYTFMWVTLPLDLNSDEAKHQNVHFKAYYLPKDDEYYQFCYVDQDGVVRGASIPFQFRPEIEEDILVVTTQGEVEEIEQQNKELHKENQELKDNCASLQKQNSDQQAELQKKQEELETLEGINQKLEQKMKEQQDCWETELLSMKEQNLKLSSENKKLGVKVDQLEVQLSTQEKEMEKLVLEDQDKTEELERLTQENEELFFNLTKQTESCNKLDQTVQEMKLNEITEVQKHQSILDPRNELTAVEEQLVLEVTSLKTKVEAYFLEKHKECQGLYKQIRHLRAAALEENFDLSNRLSENKMICDVLKREKQQLERENEILKRENSRLLSYMGLEYDCQPYQAPTSGLEGAGQNSGLVFGNPYSGIQESSAPYLKCHSYEPEFPEHIFEPTMEQQHLVCLNCPICNKIFPATEKQVFEDHVFCHSL
ncbi:LOW QUALITY PROTEIN: calcium-binding and coiled-coil domain-containing protein 2 [Suncus etruscus]|uniref:LOW QUALITY PROTEIN: calcium-binding and coiled-coil domain-containing protein 2 n=1 Tax=Suncus etruscus TaxID=109475 RepID=UPI00210FE07E|nr:LOW QUALITY PROTEIN: calcium-binding and coiled-coil domain-containing protein 2 [Suncus etruscus]